MEHDHVGLFEPSNDGDAPASELVPASRVEANDWLIRGTPGLVNGCAAGDLVRVQPDGSFSVIERGGNVAAHVYSSVALPEADLEQLRVALSALGGSVEWPATRRFAVVTVPATAGFPAIEAALASWARARHVEWYFGNVYDPDGFPLNWW